MHVRDICTISLPRPRGADVRAAASATEPRDQFLASVSETRQLWTWDFSVMPPAAKRVQATLRAAGERGEIWVDDAAWGRTVSEADVATLARRFETSAGAGAVDPSRGMYDNDVAYFGEPPRGVDTGSRVAVLLTDMASFNGTTMDGYFNGFDQMTDAEAMEKYGQHSNERNLIYLNSTRGDTSSEYMQGVLAHELSHLLQFARDPEESAWLGETLGEVAMAVNGYHTDFGHVARHQRRPSNPLESETYVDYGACYLFGTFLLERYGKAFIADVARDAAHGRESVDGALRRAGVRERFEDVLEDWVVANYADSRGVVAPGRHYASLDVPAPAEAHVVSAAAPRAEGRLAGTGAAYVRVDEACSLRVAREGEGRVQVMSFANGQLQVQRVDAGRPFEVPAGAVVALVATGRQGMGYALEMVQR